MKVKDKRKKIEKLMRMTWSSLESHLAFTYSKKLPSTYESNLFHVKCVKDYSEQIKLLSELL